jgi:DNA-binding NtrC family response regulator
LTAHFLEEAANNLHREPLTAPGELYALLENYHFPGNVRELRAMVLDAVAAHRHGGVLSLARFKSAMRTDSMEEAVALQVDAPSEARTAGRLPTLAEAERRLILEALDRSGGNQGVAATLLGISRTALNRRLAKIRAGQEDLTGVGTEGASEQPLGEGGIES